MIGHTDCRAIIVAAEYAHEVAQFKDTLDHLEHVIIRSDDYESWLAAQSDADPDIDIDIDIGRWFSSCTFACVCKASGGLCPPFLK